MSEPAAARRRPVRRDPDRGGCGAQLVGTWSGVYDLELSSGTEQGDVCVAIDRETDLSLNTMYALGMEPSRHLSVATRRRTFLKAQGSKIDVFRVPRNTGSISPLRTTGRESSW